MGASVSLAKGFVYAGTKNPVIATIGDSTFFHAGLPGLVNAIQHGANLTLIIMDNGWTSMTGMQVNPGTMQEAQHSPQRAWHQIDIEKVVRGLGVEQLSVVDPYDLAGMTDAIAASMQQEDAARFAMAPWSSMQKSARPASSASIRRAARRLIIRTARFPWIRHSATAAASVRRFATLAR